MNSELKWRWITNYGKNGLAKYGLAKIGFGQGWPKPRWPKSVPSPPVPVPRAARASPSPFVPRAARPVPVPRRPQGLLAPFSGPPARPFPGPPKISCFVFLIPPQFLNFSSFYGCLLVEFWWCLLRRDEMNVSRRPQRWNVQNTLEKCAWSGFDAILRAAGPVTFPHEGRTCNRLRALIDPSKRPPKLREPLCLPQRIKHHQNSTRRPPREGERKKIVAGE